MHRAFSKSVPFLLGAVALLAGCSGNSTNKDSEDFSKYRFVFKGAGTTQTGRKLHFRIYGND